MNREQVIATLRAHERELRQRGVLHAALFGSLARGEKKPTSDIDILIEPEPDAPVGLFEYVGIEQYLSDLFASRVDVANRRSLKAFVRPSAERDAIYAFSRARQALVGTRGRWPHLVCRHPLAGDHLRGRAPPAPERARPAS